MHGFADLILFLKLFIKSFVLKFRFFFSNISGDHAAFYQIIDAMPDFPQRRKSIPLVTDLAMALAASKRAGVPATRQTLNDEELVSDLNLNQYF